MNTNEKYKNYKNIKIFLYIPTFYLLFKRFIQQQKIYFL